MTVTVLEREPRILARVAAPETADYFRDLHRSHGVAIREGASLETLEGENGSVRRGRLDDGSEILADLVLVGIGVDPAVSLARECGLEIENGLLSLVKWSYAGDEPDGDDRAVRRELVAPPRRLAYLY